jgi:hypothetical protein
VLSFAKCGGKTIEFKPVEDYDAIVDRNLDILADGFEQNLDVDKLMDILEGKE